MAKQFRLLFGLLAIGLALAACTGGDATSVDSDSGARVDGLAGVPGTATAFPPQFGPLNDLRDIIPLQGTSWVVARFGSGPHDAAISFAWGGEAEQLVAEYNDECTSGRFTTNTRSQGGWVIVNDSPLPDCDSPMSEIFADGAIVWFDRSPDALFVESEGGTFTAAHWQSVSVHDEPLVVDLDEVDFEEIERTTLVVDVPPLEVAAGDLGDIPEATDVGALECSRSGEAGLEPNPLAAEMEATWLEMNRVVFDLPFVVSAADGGLHDHRNSIGLTVRYQPSIDWIKENLPVEHVCVEVPPIGFYDRPLFPLPEWRFVTEPNAEDTTLTVRRRGNCGPPPSIILPPQVTETASTIEVALPLAQRPYGQAFHDDCKDQPEYTLELDAPVGNREIVPASELR